MGGVVQAISHAVSEVGHAVEGVGKAIGHTAEAIGKSVANDPFQFIATVAVCIAAPYAAAALFPEIIAAEAVSAGIIAETATVSEAAAAGASALTATTSSTVALTQAGGLAIVNATDVVAHGGSIEDALKAAAISAGSSWIASSNVVTNFLSEAGANTTVAQMAQGAVRGGLSAAVQGKDVLTGLGTGALSAGIASGVVNSGIGETLKEGVGEVAGSTAISGVSGALSRGLSALVQGKDAAAGAGAGFASGVFGNATNYLTQAVGRNLDLVPESVKKYANDYWDKNVDPLVKQADTQQTDLQKQYDSIAKDNEQLQKLSTQYTEAADVLGKQGAAYNAYRDQHADKFAEIDGAGQAFNTAHDHFTSLRQAAQDAADAYNNLARTDPNNPALAGMLEDFNNKNAQATAARDATQEAYDKYNNIKELHSDIVGQADKLYKDYTDTNTKISDLQKQGSELNTALTTKVDAYKTAQTQFSTTVNQLNEASKQVDTLVGADLYSEAGLANLAKEASAGLVDAPDTSAYQSYVGIQKFDDGSSIQINDDGSQLVTDSEGHTTAYDIDGNAYTVGSNPALTGEPKEPSKASNWGNALRTSINAASAQAKGTAPSRGLSSRPNPNAISRSQQRGVGSTLSNPTAARAAGPGAAEIGAGAGALGLGLSAIGADETYAAPEDTGGSALAAINQNKLLTPVAGVHNIQEGAMKDPTGLAYLEGTNIAPGQESNYLSLDATKPILAQAGAPHSAPEQDVPYLDLSGAAAGGLAMIPSAYMNEGGQAGEPMDFMSEGGAHHVRGENIEGDGVSDSVQAMLSSGEFVIPARIVSELGNGDSEAGARRLENFVQEVNKRRMATADIAANHGDGGLAHLLLPAGE